MAHEFRDVAPGLWLWRLDYPDWKRGLGWEQQVASTCVDSAGERILLDPLAPPNGAREFWARLDERPPTAVAVLKPDHVFAEALTAPGGELRVWATPWHEDRALPALRALLDLPFEHVIGSHGEPVHDRAAYERALERPPWKGEE